MRRNATPSYLLLALVLLVMSAGPGRAADWARVQAVLSKVQRHISRLSLKVEELDRQNETVARGVQNITRRKGQGGEADVRTAQFLLDRLTAMEAEGGTLKQDIERKRIELGTFQQRIDLAFPQQRRDVHRYFSGLSSSQRKAERSYVRMSRRSEGLKNRLSTYLQTYAGSVAARGSSRGSATLPRGASTAPSAAGKNIYQMAAEAAQRSSAEPAQRSDRMQNLLSRYQVGRQGAAAVPAASPSGAMARPAASRPYEAAPSAASAVSVKRVPSTPPAETAPSPVPTLAPPVMVVPSAVSVKPAAVAPVPAKPAPRPAPAKPAPRPAPAKPAPAKPAPAKPAPAKPAPPKPVPPKAPDKPEGQDDSELDEFLELEDEASLPRPRRTEGLVRLERSGGAEEKDLFADRIEAELRRQLGEGKTAYFSPEESVRPRPAAVAKDVTPSARRRRVAGRVQSIIDELNALSKD